MRASLSGVIMIFRLPALRFTPVLLAAALASSAEAQTTVRSSPVGVVSQLAPRGESGLALPLVAADVFVGLVESNEAATLVFPAGAGDVGALLAAEGKYYVEVVTGGLEGERLDVDTEGTIAAADSRILLLLGPGTSSTLAALPPSSLAGARCVLRPHATLASLQRMFTPPLVGRDQFLLADGVQVLEGGALHIYYLRGDGVTWSRVGASGDFRHHVLPPDAGVLVGIRAAREWRHAGGVRTNAFRKNLVAGIQAFATGFPQDLSPMQVRAFVDPAAPPATRWTGNNVFLLADQFHVVFGAPRPFELFFLRADGTTWRTPTNPTNVSEQPILGATGMILLRRLRPDPAYRIPRPFGL
jgi:hypothetical protein